MSLGYSVSRAFISFIRIQCIREFVINRRQIHRPGGFVVACTHLSHLEPALVSCHTRRPIHWVARVEFFRLPWFRPILKLAGAISINRQGVPVAAIRRSIGLARSGQIVGIFPEGGVAHGPAAMIRGGPMKRGVCVIAMRAGVPVVPVVALGFETLNRVGPWLPFKRGKVWVAYGEPIFPPTTLPARRSRRAARIEMGERVQKSFIDLYAQLRGQADISDEQVP